MKCDRKWWNDGRLEREKAEHPSRLVPAHMAGCLEPPASQLRPWWEASLPFDMEEFRAPIQPTRPSPFVVPLRMWKMLYVDKA